MADGPWEGGDQMECSFGRLYRSELCAVGGLPGERSCVNGACPRRARPLGAQFCGVIAVRASPFGEGRMRNRRSSLSVNIFLAEPVFLSASDGFEFKLS